MGSGHLRLYCEVGGCSDAPAAQTISSFRKSNSGMSSACSLGVVFPVRYMSMGFGLDPCRDVLKQVSMNGMGPLWSPGVPQRALDWALDHGAASSEGCLVW